MSEGEAGGAGSGIRDHPGHGAAEAGAFEGELSGLGEEAEHFAGGGGEHHGHVQAVGEVDGPSWRADRDEIAIGLEVSVGDHGLAGGEEGDVLRSGGIVVGEAEQLVDADLDGVSAAGVMFELIEVAGDAVAFGVVPVDGVPAVLDEPAVDAIGVGLRFIEGDIAGHPFDVGIAAGGVVGKDTDVGLIDFVAAMDEAMVLGHDAGEVVVGADVGLLEEQGFFVVFSGHVKTEISAAAEYVGEGGGAAVGGGEIGLLFEGEGPVGVHRGQLSSSLALAMSAAMVRSRFSWASSGVMSPMGSPKTPGGLSAPGGVNLVGSTVSGSRAMVSEVSHWAA